jgi:phosphoribosyl 1,2-cyclic phosphodiesterase
VIEVAFHGVRGSTPCCGETVRRYGGNTSCVSVHRDGAAPIVFDLGTGLRQFGLEQGMAEAYHGTILLSHLHWDHVQGLPFFVPLLREGSEVDVWAPVQEDGRSVREAFDTFLRPPYFPVCIEALPGKVRFHEVADEHFDVGDAQVLARTIPHVGRTNGYRLSWGGVTVAYLSDHQQPTDGDLVVPEGALTLCEGADLVIHDAQYTPDEFDRKQDWGHCTVEFALQVAYEAGAKGLALFHHDPLRTDDQLDEIARCTRPMADRLGISLHVAADGMRLSLSG